MLTRLLVPASQVSDPTYPQPVFSMALANIFESWKQWKERRARKKYRQGLERKARKRRPPLHTSPDSVTFLGANLDEQGRNATHQQSSFLLTKLAYDIRLEIYQAVLGDRCLHIVQKCARLSFLFCTAEDSASHRKYGCWGYQNPDGTFYMRYWKGGMRQHERAWSDEHWRAMCRTDGDLLPILLTCRQM